MSPPSQYFIPQSQFEVKTHVGYALAYQSSDNKSTPERLPLA